MNIEQYKNHIEQAFEKAQQGISKCSEELLNMPGMSGKKTRHLYNNLLNMSDARYLEIGVWLGSSTCSALYKNDVKYAYAIDNWIEYGGPKAAFEGNIKHFDVKEKLTFLESDFMKVNVQTLPTFNIYLFDGGHEYEDHVMALFHMIDCLDDVFIYIVDDWNWRNVRAATKFAIEQCNLSILHGIEVRMTLDDLDTPPETAKEEFWNGVCILLLQKNHSNKV